MASRMTDDDLMARLRAVGSQVDPVPDDVVMAGRSALAYRDLDVRLAELVEEQTMAEAGTRSDVEGSWFTFELDDLVIEFAVQNRDDRLQLVGHVDGGDAQVQELVVRQEAAIPCPTDDIGRFSTEVASGPVRVDVTLTDGRRIATSWVIAASA